MKLPKFILRKDWNIETEFAGIKNKILIFSKGKVFESDDNGDYIIESLYGRMVSDVEGMKSASDNGDILFDMVEEKKDIEIKVEEISDNDEELIKNWRIQLDVKTSRKKLKEIEKIINEKVKEIL
jgi:hypothetical protein